MSGDLDEALRAALRPVDPGEGFTREVMSRLTDRPLRPFRAWVQRAALPLAASLLVALAGAGFWHAQRVREGEQARLQLLEALRVTGQKLDVAYRAVNEPRPLPGHSGT